MRLFIEVAGMFAIVVAAYIFILYLLDHVFNVADKRLAIDYLPFPVYFGLNNKLPLVVNDKMYALIYELKGTPLSDMENDLDCLFENNLEKDEVEEELALKYNALYFVNYEDNVYFIDERVVFNDGESITQITGQDITEEYNELCELRTLNAKIREQNERLKEHFKTVAEVNHQQELLNAKIGIHGKMGDCIAMTRHLIKNPVDLTLKKKVEGLWEQVVLGFTESPVEGNDLKKGYEELQRISGLAGCRIITNGTLPGGEAGHFMIKILREALNNAIRHANASSLTVEVMNFESDGLAKIYDDGHPSKEFTKLGGGLSSIKENFERNGIIMDVTDGERFEIALKFPKYYINKEHN